LYQRFGIQLNDAERLREWAAFTKAMEEKFENMSVLNCYPYNLNTAAFDEYYWNLGANVFACFVVNLVVHVGKYYYEIVIVDDLLAHVGWTTLDHIPDTQEGEVCFRYFHFIFSFYLYFLILLFLHLYSSLILRELGT
jgi:hypothetical protein